MASPMSGDHQGEASTAIVSLVAHKDEVASSMPQNPAADAGTPHFAPAADNERDPVASPLARDPRQQVASEHRVRPLVKHCHGKGRPGPAVPVSVTQARPAALRAQGLAVPWPPLPGESPQWRGRQELPHRPPSPLPTALLPPQAWPPSRTPQLDSDGPPSSGGRSGLCTQLSTVPASRDSKRNSAPLPAPCGSPKMAAGPEPASIQKERQGEAHEGWVHGQRPRHSAALRTFYCQPLLGCGSFLRPIKMTIFPQCSSVPVPSQEKDSLAMLRDHSAPPTAHTNPTTATGAGQHQ
ncbi:LOW QUALITY PROTEIN: basic proline-rich protein-like [Gavia stellata]|uniref:LOW QUALITY PROTEIN: basic proline-rich protein-like n=1 Tax=Gavia stellata TaxID=37040 RepID=UPI00289EBB21|nr:LOW QUALITY PROTEIN: basic proline-rich protein-like [Gavia stellata]